MAASATLLLAICAARHYGIYLVPVEQRAQAWNALGAICISILLLAVIWHMRSRIVQAIAGWWLLEEAMVAGCSLLYIWRPWVVLPGQDQCSALLGFDLGLLGVFAIVCLAVCLPTKVCR